MLNKLLIVSMIFLLSGCVNEVKNEESILNLKVEKQQKKIKITGVGYGATSMYNHYTVGQQTLMAIRASKLDAYRSLVEQIEGININSNTNINAFSIKNDNFRAKVNGIVKGAKLISVTPLSDGNYETILELEYAED